METSEGSFLEEANNNRTWLWALVWPCFLLTLFLTVAATWQAGSVFLLYAFFAMIDFIPQNSEGEKKNTFSA